MMKRKKANEDLRDNIKVRNTGLLKEKTSVQKPNDEMTVDESKEANGRTHSGKPIEKELQKVTKQGPRRQEIHQY